MRTLIPLLLVVALGAAKDVNAKDEDVEEAKDVTHDVNAYIMFKLNTTRMMNKVKSLHIAAANGEDYEVNMDDTPFMELKYVLINLKLEEATTQSRSHIAHKALSRVSAVLCRRFPACLVFDKYFLEDGVIKGRAQNFNLDEFTGRLAAALNEVGIVHDAHREDPQSVKTGFVAYHGVRNDWRSTDSTGKLREDLRLRLDTAVHVDTIHLCERSRSGGCAETYTAKIKSCSSYYVD